MKQEELVEKYSNLSHVANDHPLYGINSIEWHKLNHAYGSAYDVPPLLNAALSHTEYDREMAFDILNHSIWHQGTIYEASPHVVPFLYNMLTWILTPNKTWCGVLLANLATGNSYHEMLLLGTPRIASNRDYTIEIKRELTWVNTTKLAVEKQLPLLYQFVTNEDPWIRAHVAKAFGQYPAYAEQTLPLLENAIERESDEFSRDEIALVIEWLRKTKSV
jgi:hypothetical protein